MLSLRNACYVFLLLWAAWPARAQNPVSRHYTVDDGLPSNEVYDVFEDSLGYIWFATDHGISRFNGYEFKNYSTSDGLSHNTIFGFHEDLQHRVWMRAFNSTLCYIENGAIRSYRHNAILKAFLGRNFIQSFGFDEAGNLWFNSIQFPYGLYCQDRITGSIRKMPQPGGFNAYVHELGNNRFISGVELSEGSLTLNDSVRRTRRTLYYTAAMPTLEVDRAVVRTACAGKDHYLLSYGSMGTELKNGRVIRRLSMGHRQIITSIYPEASKGFWLTGNGLFLSTPDTLLHFFDGWALNCVRKDRRGGYWLACSDKGVLYIPDFSFFVYRQENPGNIYLLGRSNHHLYAVTKAAELQCMPLGPDGPGKPEQSVALVSWAHDLWINPRGTGLHVGARQYRLDAQGHIPAPHLVPDAAHGAAPKFGSCRSAFSDGRYLYLSGNNGWAMVDEKADTAYVSQQHGFSSFCSGMCRDSSGRIWIGSTDGLYQWSHGRTEAFRHTDQAFRQTVSMIRCRADGLVIVSTRGNGLLLIDKHRHYNIGKRQGLSSNLCGRFAIDDSLLWVCTNNGLNRVLIRRQGDSLQFSITPIHMGHGLPSNLVYDALRYKDLLLLATGKGLTWFDVRRFTLNPYTPPVYMDAVLANQRPIAKNAMLDCHENNLSFGFTGLLYNNNGRLSYRYRLGGYESGWHYTAERRVHYYNLPAGNYTFEVAAMNENGTWSTQPVRFAFMIPLHFTKSGWFILLVIAGIAGAAGFSVWYYLRQKRLQERLTSDMLLAELKTLRSQMKPHFLFNSLNSIQHFILRSDPESAHHYLSRFSELMRRILNNTRKDSISLAQETDTLELYLSLEKLRFENGFDYSLQIDPQIDGELTEIPPMLIQPHVENAIWHGLLPRKADARLWLRFYPAANATLVCEIEDNGIGRKAAALLRKSGHRSTGLRNMEERIGILNRMNQVSVQVELIDLYNADSVPAGTRVVLKFTNALVLKTDHDDKDRTDRR